MNKKTKTVAIIVAHPDDETLWAGGTILSHPEWNCYIASLCRKNDPDRAPKFFRVLKTFGARGKMGNLDDGPQQEPLDDLLVQNSILDLLPTTTFDLIITHSIYGEYTRHRRHEETGRAVITLWTEGKIKTGELLTFAYQDYNHTHFPQAIEGSPLFYPLEPKIWEQKYHIITNIYGFEKDSWEAQTTPKTEAFLQFNNTGAAYKWLLGTSITA